jgi:nucleotide-binding universal stress UspA family protein
VTIGAALLGWVAGEMAVTDPSVQDWIDARAAWPHYGAPAAGALLIVILGKGLAARAAAREEARPALDLATASDQGQATGAATAGLTFLFSADHSDGAMRAAEALVKTLPRYRDPVKLHLLNVQPTAHADVGAFVGKKDIADYHHEQGLAALKPVREILDRAGIPYTAHIGVGDLPQVIANYAKQTRSDQIFVGVSAGRRLAAATSGLVDISVTLMR